jgi:hypothetical protein
MAVNLTIDVASADNQKDIFEKVAQYQEVFGTTKCPACGGTDLRYVVREHDGNKYYELRCNNPDCRAKLAFGAHKAGNTLFPKKWVKWDGKQEVEVE